ncbi:unnamed protein product [Symbiodinium sp. CCMP2592]|nr:unnamed protein product [Symbiodinium sp. CCMP2592]
MPPDPAKKLADLVQQAGRLHSLPEHSRAEHERELFGEVRLGLLQPDALEGSFEEHDMAAMLRLMVSCGSKKRLASRAVENLKQFLNSRSWLKVAHGSPELLLELKGFLLENPEVTKDADMTAVASLLEAPPSDSRCRPDSPTSPAKLDDDTRRMILEPLQRGRELMASCRWHVLGDESGQALSLFCRGVTRLAGTAVGREAMDAPGAELPVLDWLASDWPNIIKFLANVYELKRLNRSQIEACAWLARLLDLTLHSAFMMCWTVLRMPDVSVKVEKLRSLSHSFSEAEASAEGAACHAVLDVLLLRGQVLLRLFRRFAMEAPICTAHVVETCRDIQTAQFDPFAMDFGSKPGCDRNLLKKESGCAPKPQAVHHGRAHRRQLLVAALRKLDNSPMPNADVRGSCAEGLWTAFFGGLASKESGLAKDIGRPKCDDGAPEDTKDDSSPVEVEEAEEPPPPPPPLPPPAEEEKPGLLKRILWGGKAEEPAVPPAPPAPVPAPTVVVPKAAPAAAGYPSDPPGSGAPARAPKAAAKPGVVWVDVNPKAWQKTTLNGHTGLSFQGFDGTQETRPWLSYVQQRAASDERVAVLILNRRHKSDAVAIKQFCASKHVPPPQFIVCGKGAPEEVCREWGMQDIHVTKDWDEATRIALSEVRTPGPLPLPRTPLGTVQMK